MYKAADATLKVYLHTAREDKTCELCGRTMPRGAQHAVMEILSWGKIRGMPGDKNYHVSVRRRVCGGVCANLVFLRAHELGAPLGSYMKICGAKRVSKKVKEWLIPLIIQRSNFPYVST